MPSYVITGVSRGIGYEFLRQYSSDPNNTVIGLVRDKAATDKKVSEDADLKGRSNIHIIAADVTDYEALKKAASQTADITRGSLDYIIANAGYVPTFDQFDGIGDFADQPENVTREMRTNYEVNVIGNVHLFNLFLPLVKKGEAKKVITLTSGYADVELTRTWNVTLAPFYSASKAAMNMVIAKFSAQYRKEGILFLGISPGVVDVGLYNNSPPEDVQRMGAVFASLTPIYAPSWRGPITPLESVAAMRSVITNASVEGGYGGDFISHYGNKQWI